MWCIARAGIVGVVGALALLVAVAPLARAQDIPAKGPGLFVMVLEAKPGSTSEQRLERAAAFLRSGRAAEFRRRVRSAERYVAVGAPDVQFLVVETDDLLALDLVTQWLGDVFHVRVYPVIREPHTDTLERWQRWAPEGR